jgi:hypothetical protein
VADQAHPSVLVVEAQGQLDVPLFVGTAQSVDVVSSTDF